MSDEESLKSGYLFKSPGQVLGKWKRRWFVLELDPPTLSYYENHSQHARAGRKRIQKAESLLRVREVVAGRMQAGLQTETVSLEGESFPLAFSGEAAMRWLVDARLVRDDDHAAELCGDLIASGIMAHLPHHCPFVPGPDNFYRFTRAIPDSSTASTAEIVELIKKLGVGSYGSLQSGIDIDLREAHVTVDTNPKAPTAFVFQLHTPGRVYQLAAESQEDLDEWTSAVRSLLEQMSAVRARGGLTQGLPVFDFAERETRASVAGPAAGDLPDQPNQPNQHRTEVVVTRVDLDVDSDAEVQELEAAMVEVFLTNEPLCQALGLARDEFQPSARDFVRSCAASGLSFVARKGPRVVGFALLEDFAEMVQRRVAEATPETSQGACSFCGEADHPSAQHRCKICLSVGFHHKRACPHNKKMRPILGLLHDAHNSFLHGFRRRVERDVRRGEIAHLAALGVVPSAARTGAAIALLQHAHAHLRERGYAGVLAEATGYASQNLMDVLLAGHPPQDRFEVDYTAWLFKGAPPFAHVEAPTCKVVYQAFPPKDGPSDRFQRAVMFAAAHKGLLHRAFDRDDFFRFYGLLQQGTHGPCMNEPPPDSQVAARRKWAAWNDLGTLEPAQAKQDLLRMLDLLSSSVDELADGWEALTPYQPPTAVGQLADRVVGWFSSLLDDDAGADEHAAEAEQPELAIPEMEQAPSHTHAHALEETKAAELRKECGFLTKKGQVKWNRRWFVLTLAPKVELRYYRRPLWEVPATRPVISDADADDLEFIAERIMSGVDIGTHTYHLQAYHNCFLGSKAVKFMVAQAIASGPDHAVAIGQRLVQHGLVEHVTGAHQFKNQGLFYRFAASLSPEERQSHAADTSGRLVDLSFASVTTEPDPKAPTKFPLQIVTPLATVQLCAESPQEVTRWTEVLTTATADARAQLGGRRGGGLRSVSAVSAPASPGGAGGAAGAAAGAGAGEEGAEPAKKSLALSVRDAVIRHDSNGDKYVQYAITVRSGARQWDVGRRYSEIREFVLRLEADGVALPDGINEFPPRTFFCVDTLSPTFVEARRAALQEFLDELFKNEELPQHPAVKAFVSVRR